MQELSPHVTCQGQVIAGEQVGRTIGFPTANLDFLPQDQELEPGVYGAKVTTVAGNYLGLAYFGPRLIFGEVQPNFEVYLLEFEGDLYGQTLTVELTHFLRPPYPLKDLAELKAQLQADVDEFRCCTI